MRNTLSPLIKKAVIIIGVIAVILGIIVLFKVRAFVENLQDPKYIASLLSHEIGCPVTIEEVKMSMTGKLILRKVFVKAPQETMRDEEFFSSTRVTVSFSPLEIITDSKNAGPHSIELLEPQLSLTPDNIAWCEKKLHQEGPSRDIPAITVKSGSVSLSGLTALADLSVKGIKGKIASKQGITEFNFKGTSEDLYEKWEMKGTFRSAADQEMKITGRNVDLALLAERLKQKLPMPLSGKAKLFIETTKDKDAPWQGSIESESISLDRYVLTRFASRFIMKKELCELPSLSFGLFHGTFNGRGSISLSKKNPSLSVEGSVASISLEDATGKGKDLTLKGALSGPVSLSYNGREVLAQGNYSLTQAMLGKSLDCSNAQGSYLIRGEELILSKNSFTTQYGSFAVDGSIRKDTFNIKVSSSSFEASKLIDFSRSVTIPHAGSVNGILKGTASRYQFKGSIELPGIMIDKRELKGTAVKGTVEGEGHEITLKDMEATVCGVTFPVEGRISGKEKDTTLISLKGIPLNLAADLAGLKIPDAEKNNNEKQSGRQSAPQTLSLDLRCRGKEMKGTVNSGKGQIYQYSFDRADLSFSAIEGKPLTFSGTLHGKEKLTFSGTGEKGLLSFSARAPQITYQDYSLKLPELRLTVQQGKTPLIKGDLKAQELKAGPESLSGASVSFSGDSTSSLSFTGKSSWKNNPFTIDGKMGSLGTVLTLISPQVNLESLIPQQKGAASLSGMARVKADITLRKKDMTYKVSLASQNAAVGSRKFPPFTAQLEQDRDMLKVTKLEFTKDNASLLVLEGLYSIRNNHLSLKSSLKDRSLDDLSSFAETGGAALHGKLSGMLTLEGKPENLVLSYTGSVSQLSLKDTGLGNGKLSLSMTDGKGSGNFSPDNPDALLSSFLKSQKDSKILDTFLTGWKDMKCSFSQRDGHTVDLSGDSNHSRLGKVTFKGSLTKEGWDMEFTPQQLSFDKISFTAPVLHLTQKDEKMTGTIRAASGLANDTAITKPAFNFEQKTEKTLVFSGTCGIFDTEANISGEGTDDGMQILLKIPQGNIRKLNMLPLKDDSLSGTVSVEARINEGKEKTFKATVNGEGLKWKDKKLPRVYLEAEKKKGLILIPQLRIYLEGKPAFFTGNIFPEKQTCILNGRLDGNRITSLVDLMGGTSPDTEGLIVGAVAIEGEMMNPDFKFDGRINNLVYQGKNMGNGTLKLSGNKDAIKGRLDMDKPPKVRTGVSQANVEISFYFLIEGTPKHMVFKPQNANTSVHIDPNLIWKIFQMSH
ncbi:MAG: hypothetical protein AB2L14_26315 [Candidatus Xenobiia bacterium LiM19]